MSALERTLAPVADEAPAVKLTYLALVRSDADTRQAIAAETALGDGTVAEALYRLREADLVERSPKPDHNGGYAYTVTSRQCTGV